MNFYYLMDKDVGLQKNMIMSPQCMIDNGMTELALKALDKYRDRIVGKWNIRPDKKAEDLTLEEIVEALKTFRGEDALKRMYLFRFLPYKELGKNMEKLLENKIVFKFDLNRLEETIISNIYWGHEKSHNDNKMLTREYYENITKAEYFKDYNDNDPLKYSTINHISITTVRGNIPLELGEELTDYNIEKDIHIAVRECYISKIKSSLEYCYVDSKTRMMQTSPLHKIIELHTTKHIFCENIVKCLIDNKANVNAIGIYYNHKYDRKILGSPLDFAINILENYQERKNDRENYIKKTNYVFYDNSDYDLMIKSINKIIKLLKKAGAKKYIEPK